ncbi:MAG TPA: hemerythrin domain-containing protein [Edaphocola sp.]|nr:hemerythrin domain-containing protein [Edaphocola sp.]
MENKPIKRSAEIMPLSREHHFSLLFSWKILQGLKNGVALSRIVDYAAHFWENNLRLHFEQEEVVLFNRFPDDGLVRRALGEHRAMRELFEALSKEKGAGQDCRRQLEDLAQLIKSHVRMEERELFPVLEQRLSGKALKQAAVVLHDMRDTPLNDDYADEFWNTKNE